MPTVSYGSIGTAGSGITSAAPGYPAGIAAGDLLVLVVANKYPNDGPAETAGFTFVSNGQGLGGAGAPGPDSGDCYATVLTKEATGSESGTETITVSSGNSTAAFIARFTKSGGSWSIAACNGGDTSSDTSWSVTGDLDPGVITGDFLVACCGVNNNLSLGSAHVITQTGVTFAAGVEIADNSTSFGDNVGTKISYHEVTAGPSSGVPTYTCTLSIAGAGATVILRIRAVDTTAITGLGRRYALRPQ
jgi:hypothetical protein